MTNSWTTWCACLEALRNRGYYSILGKSEASLPFPVRRCNFNHQKKLSPFPERLELPYPSGKILSCYEEDVSFIRNSLNVWFNANPDDTIKKHMVDVRKNLRGILWSICSKAGRTFSIVFLRQQRAKPFIRSEETEHLQLESRTSTWKRGRYRETNCKKISDHLSLEHFCVENQLEFFFRALLFVPRWFFHSVEKDREERYNIKLFLRGVLIMNDCDELIPEWLNFVASQFESVSLGFGTSLSSWYSCVSKKRYSLCAASLSAATFL